MNEGRVGCRLGSGRVVQSHIFRLAYGTCNVPSVSTRGEMVLEGGRWEVGKGGLTKGVRALTPRLYAAVSAHRQKQHTFC